MKKGFLALSLAMLSTVTLSTLATLAHADTPPIKLGIALPLTGELASIGEDARAGVALAVEDINAKGGVLGRKVTADVADDACDPKNAVAVANRFVSENVDAATELCSAACMAEGPVYAEENIPFVMICSTQQATSQGWGNIVRAYPDNNGEAKRLASLIKALSAQKKLALIYDPQEYDANLYKNISTELNATNVKPDMTINIPNGTVDFSSYITELRAKKIDVVYLGVFVKSVGLFLRQAHDAGYHPQFISSQVATVQDVETIAGTSALEGMIYTDIPDPKNIPTAAGVLKALAARGLVDRPFAVYSYAQVEAYLAAVKAAGTTDKTAVEKVLHSQNLNTILGSYGFDAAGNLRGFDFRYVQWRNGKRQVWKAP
ncbi:MAG: branched-chain amino acid ABC transporter substrate-binding protein [Alphaproteobacteria bacterium]|nr:branched-chain amino acid ABC transporter substrate-binding protein [Alphaproteobacteria bacterium]